MNDERWSNADELEDLLEKLRDKWQDVANTSFMPEAAKAIVADLNELLGVKGANMQSKEWLLNEMATDVDLQIGITPENFNWLEERLKRLASDLEKLTPAETRQ